MTATDLLIPAVVPTVHRILETPDVALCIKGDRAEYGLVSALMQRLFNQFYRCRSRLFSCLCKNLDRGIGIKGVALGIETLGPEPLDHLSRRSQLAWLRSEGHQRALSSRAGEVPILLRERARSDHHRCG